ncbi:hypothetical protein D1872_212040 [compost metagenome]
MQKQLNIVAFLQYELRIVEGRIAFAKEAKGAALFSDECDFAKGFASGFAAGELFGLQQKKDMLQQLLRVANEDDGLFSEEMIEGNVIHETVCTS